MSPAQRDKDRERKWGGCWGGGRRKKLPLEERKAREKEEILG